jgi:hypothetical protein
VVFFIAFPLYVGQISLRLASTSSFARVAACYLGLCDMEQLQVKIRHFSKTYDQQVIYKPFCEYGQGWWQGAKTSTALKVGALILGGWTNHYTWPNRKPVLSLQYWHIGLH